MPKEETPVQRIGRLTAEFPMTPIAKDEAIATALRDVPIASIQQVVDALDLAVPIWTWVSNHALDQSKVIEHAIEEGRLSVITSLKYAIDMKKKGKETAD